MTRLLLRLLPAEWRDAIEGDLREEAEQRPGGWRRGAWVAMQVAVLAAGLAMARLRDRLSASAPGHPRSWVADALTDARFGVRRWRAHPLVALAAVATLALGIGATSALFSIVDGVLLKPLPYPASERLVVVNRSYPEWRNDPILAASWNRISLSWPEYFYIREKSRTLEALAVQTTMMAVIGGGEARESRVGVASASLFTMLGVTPRLGSLFSPGDDLRDPRTVLISHGLWLRRFGGDPGIVGRTLRLDAGDRVIAGVLPADFAWDRTWGWAGYDLWFPLGAFPDAWRADNNRNFDATARLRPGVSLDQASDEMTALLRATFRFKDATGGIVTPLAERQTGRVRRPLLLLLAGAILLLAIACANVAGLLVGDAASRSGEIAVRAALGAGRARLVRQLCAEGMLLSLAGTAAGLVLALWGVRALVALAPANLPRLNQVTVDGRAAALAAAAGLMTTLLFALVPASGLRRDAPARFLGSGRRATMGAQRMTSVLAVAEIALGVALLVGAGLFVRSFTALRGVEAGFDRSHLLALRVRLPASRYAADRDIAAYFERAQQRLRTLPGAADVALSSTVALSSGRAGTSLVLKDRPPGARTQFEVQRRFVSPEYFDTMKIRRVAGRTFDATDRLEGPAVAVVSETLARSIWPGGDAIGRRFDYGTREHEVIGVVSDVLDITLDATPKATFYLSTKQWLPWPTMRLMVRTTGEPSALASAARRAVTELDPEVPIEDVETMDDIVVRATEEERYRTVLMCVFAALAAVLAGAGLYATLARRVSDRRREIGVRLAMGARPSQVRRLFLGEGVRLALAGAALGLPVAIGLARLAASLLFGVTPADPMTLALVVVATTALAIVATYLPAHRASRLEPLAVLRSE